MLYCSIRCIMPSCAVLLLALANPANAQQVLVASDTNLLGVLDFSTFSTTGAATFTKINTLGETIVCMGYGSNNNLYGLDTAGNFYEIDPATGNISTVGARIAVVGSITSAAWDGKNTMYVLDSGDTLQSVDLSAPFTHQTHSLGALPSTNTAVPDGFMALDKPLASGGTIYIGALDPNRSSPNDALYKINFNASGTISGLSHPGGATGNTGFKALTDGVNVNSTLYGFGKHPDDNNANAAHSIFAANVAGNPSSLLSYYNLGGGNITAAIISESSAGGVPESGTLTLMSLMLGAGGCGLLLHRKRARA